jgi:DNA-binding CsgD family transcriptional regulator
VADGQVTFPQALLRSVAYHEATLAQRRAAHGCLAQVLDPSTLRHLLHRAEATSGPDDLLAAELEREATESVGNADRARALTRAAELTGDSALAAARLVTAARYAWHAGDPVRAWTILRRVPPARTPVDLRARSTVLAGEIELRTGRVSTARHTFLAAATFAARDRYLALAALLRAGEALCLAGGYPRYPDIARKAFALRGPDETPGAQVVFDHFATLSATFRGHHRQAVGPARRLFTAASTMDDPDTLTRTSMAALFRGNEAEAYGLATRAVRTARAAGDMSVLAPAMEAVTLAEFLLGGYDNTASGREGLRLARESGQDTLAGNYLAVLAMFAAVTGDRSACLARLRLSPPAGQRFGRAGAFRTWALAALDLADGRHADVVRRLGELTVDRNGGGHLVVRVSATPHLVEAAVRSDRRAVAVDAVKVYDSWAASTGNPHWLALSARCHALLAVNPDEAEEHFRVAMDRHAATPNEFDLARTGLLFGQHLRRRRKPKLAKELLHSALATFERFDARPWAGQAVAELRAAGHPTPPTGTSVTGTLTPHQVQIAQLVAEGATNREVAARMLVSPRTVDHHMRNIFAKLGVRSRVELAKLMR